MADTSNTPLIKKPNKSSMRGIDEQSSSAELYNDLSAAGYTDSEINEYVASKSVPKQSQSALYNRDRQGSTNPTVFPGKDNVLEEDRVKRFDNAYKYLPIGATPSDTVLHGQRDDTGKQLYRTASGDTYVIPDVVTESRGSSVLSAGKAAAEYLRNPTLPTADQVKGAATGVVRSVLDPIEALASGNATNEDLFNATLNTGSLGTAAVGKEALKFNPNKLNIFGGLGAKEAPSPTFKLAEQMDKSGETGTSIYYKTGWFRDENDGKWRFEIDDSKSEIGNIDKQTQEVYDTGKEVKLKLSDVLSHDTLYKQYPNLKNNTVVLQKLPRHEYGWYAPSTGDIGLNAELPQKLLKSTLLHEIQHAVQHIEKFQGGTNPARIGDTSFPQLKYISDTLDGLYSKVSDAIAAKDTKLAEKYRVKIAEQNNLLSNTKFAFYEGKTGEIEARLVQARKDMSEQDRRYTAPDATRRDLTYKRDVYTNSLGEPVNTPSPIAHEMDTSLSTDENIKNILRRDVETKPIANLKYGDDITSILPKEEAYLRGKVTFEGFGIHMDPESGNRSVPQINMIDSISDPGDSYIYVPTIKYRIGSGENTKFGEVDLSSVVFKDKNKSTADLRYGTPTTDNPTNMADDIADFPTDVPEEPKKGRLRKLLGFADGGAVTQMDNQMNTLMAEGGLKTDGATVDPVSGNEVPAGSNPIEVRDTIDAKLSDGEYVVPADVVKFFGVQFFEKLREKAKVGLDDMNKDGRIGGEPVADDEESLPFSVEELQAMDDAEGMDAQMQQSGFATGGVATADEILANTSSFNASTMPIGFSAFGTQAPQQAAPAAKVATGSKVYVNAAGLTVVIPVDASGNPTTPVPEGYHLAGSADAAMDTNKSDSSWAERQAEQGNKPGAITLDGKASTSLGSSGLKKEDFASPKTLNSSGLSDLKGMKTARQVGGLGGTLVGGPLVGLGAGAAGAGIGLSKARAKIAYGKEMGWDMSELEAAEKAVTDQIGANSIISKIAPGTGRLKKYKTENTPTTPTAPTAPTGGGGSKSGSGGSSPTIGGVSYRTNDGGSRDSNSGMTATGSTAPTSGRATQAAPSRPASVSAASTAKNNKQASSAASAMSKGARTGLAKGGLITKPKKTKAK